MHARKKKSADGKPANGRTRILTDSTRKRNGKEVLANYNKTRINIGDLNELWMELKEALRVQPLMLKCNHQCYCACTVSLEINDAGRQAAHKKQRKYMFFFLVKSLQTT
jgi:hypothetical protein